MPYFIQVQTHSILNKFLPFMNHKHHDKRLSLCSPQSTTSKGLNFWQLKNQNGFVSMQLNEKGASDRNNFSLKQSPESSNVFSSKTEIQNRQLSEEASSKIIRICNNPNSSVTTLSGLRNLNIRSTFSILIQLLTEFVKFKRIGRDLIFTLDSWVANDEGNIFLIDKFDYISNEKINNEITQVSCIVHSMTQICGDIQFNDFIAYYQRVKSKKICDYKYTLSLAKSYCLCSKITVNSLKPFTFEHYSQKFVDSRLLKPKRDFCLSVNSNRSQKAKSLHKSVQKTSYTTESRINSLQKKLKQKANSREKSVDLVLKKQVKGQKNKLWKSNKGERNCSSKTSKNINKTPNESQDSIDFKSANIISSLKGKCSESYTFNQNKSSIDQQRIYANPIIPTFKSAQLAEVHSQSESLDNEKQKMEIIVPIRQVEQPAKDEYSNQILLNNQWIRKYDNLHTNQKEVLQSFVEGKNEDFCMKINNSQNLGKLARTVVQSFLPLSGRNTER